MYGMGVFLWIFQCFCVAFLCFEYLCLQEITFLFCGWCWFVSGGFSGSGGRGVRARELAGLIDLDRNKLL